MSKVTLFDPEDFDRYFLHSYYFLLIKKRMNIYMYICIAIIRYIYAVYIVIFFTLVIHLRSNRDFAYAHHIGLLF